jgi:hypothetical protein
MNRPDHTLADRFPTLPKKDPLYTLHYSQPRLARVEPHNVIWEKKEERFTARDDNDARTKTKEFLTNGSLVLMAATFKRQASRLVLNHPYRIILDYFRPEADTGQGQVRQELSTSAL